MPDFFLPTISVSRHEWTLCQVILDALTSTARPLASEHGWRYFALSTDHWRDRDMFGDPLFWICVLPGLLFGPYAQWRIKLNFAKYSQVRTEAGATGAEVARRLLDSQGLQKVAIESTPGILKDHYDPRSKILRLSQDVYFAPSVAAAGVAAHEAGHALQDAEDYLPLEARTYIVPVRATRFKDGSLAVYCRHHRRLPGGRSAARCLAGRNPDAFHGPSLCWT
jgi:hypothetical protein